MKAEFLPRRTGKTLLAVEATKKLQAQGKNVVWATADQTATAEMLSKHGALSEVMGEHFLKPRFRP